MAETYTVLEIDCSTGQAVTRPMTAAEKEVHLALEAEQAAQAAADAAQVAKIAAVNAKLAAIGLTQDDLVTLGIALKSL